MSAVTDIAALRQRDGDWCYLCGYEVKLWNPQLTDGAAVSRDHVKPKALGGGNDLTNLRLAHRRCNELRGIGGGVNGASELQELFIADLRKRGYKRNLAHAEAEGTKIPPDHFSVSFAVRGFVVELKWIQNATLLFRLAPKQSGGLV